MCSPCSSLVYLHPDVLDADGRVERDGVAGFGTQPAGCERACATLSPMAMTVVSWNVLADAYVRPDLYDACDPAAVHPEAGRRRVLDRIAHLDADVVCLQEVEAPLAASLGARFVQKTDRPDGCAILVRAGLAHRPLPDIRFADSSGHVALVEDVGGLVIVTTHLKWRAGLPQAKQLAALVYGPSVVCGDLNVVADDDVIRVLEAVGVMNISDGAPSAVVNGRAKRIDILLTNVAASAMPTVVLTDSMLLPSLEEPSDHVPIGAVIQFDPEQPR